METLPHQHQNSWLESDFYQMLLFQKFRLQQGLETRKGGGNERLKSKRCFLPITEFSDGGHSLEKRSQHRDGKPHIRDRTKAVS